MTTESTAMVARRTTYKRSQDFFLDGPKNRRRDGEAEGIKGKSVGRLAA